MSINSKSNLPVLVQQAKAMPHRNKTHMFYLFTTIVVLSGILIATSF